MKKRLVTKRLAMLCMAGLMMIGAGAFGASDAMAMPASGISNASANVRNEIGGTLVGGIQPGQKVAITGEKTSADGYTWYSITYTINNVEKAGWIRGDLLDTSDKTLEELEADGDTTGADAESADDDASVEGAYVNGTKGYEFTDSLPTELPEGFESAEMNIRGENRQVAKMTAGDVVLLYMQDSEDETQKTFVVYDEDRDDVTPFVTVGDEDAQIILKNVPLSAAETVSDRFVEANCDVENGEIIGYQILAADDTVSADIAVADFYYVYGVSADGSEGWYSYDSKEKTAQRSTVNMQYSAATQADVDDAAAQTESSDSILELDDMTKMLLAGLGVVCLLLLILFIVVSARYRRLCSYIEEEYDSLDDENDEDDEDDERLSRREIAAREKAERKSRKEEEKFQRMLALAEDEDVLPKAPEVAKDESEDPLEEDFLAVSRFMDGSTDYDLTTENSPEDEAEYERFEEEPEYFDEEEELSLEKILLDGFAEPEVKNAMTSETQPEEEQVEDILPELIDAEDLFGSDDLLNEVIDEVSDQEAQIDQTVAPEPEIQAEPEVEADKDKSDSEDFNWDDLEFL